MGFFSKNDKPVFREIFLSDENRKLRIILLCVFLGIGLIALYSGINSFLSVEPGWQEIEVLSDGVNCGADFTMQYYFADSGAASTAVKKDLTTLYSDACHKAYQLFTPDAQFENINNIYTLNHSINQEIEVDPVLYSAFSLLEESGDRSVFLGPVYQQYNNIFFANSDEEAAYWDPKRDTDSADYMAEILAFARDTEHICLKLLGDNKVVLQVSEEYVAFAKENEVENLIDFHWMTNAFIIDYFAALLAEKGYTNGFIASRDGFACNLSSGTEFAQNLFDRIEQTIVPVGSMLYDQPTNIVYLRSYPMTREDNNQYYTYADGTVVSPYIDATDGLDRTGTPQLICYSGDMGCARMLLQVAPLFVADQLDAQALAALTDEQIQSIWFKDQILYHTDAQLRLSQLLQDETYQYAATVFQ